MITKLLLQICLHLYGSRRRVALVHNCYHSGACLSAPMLTSITAACSSASANHLHDGAFTVADRQTAVDEIPRLGFVRPSASPSACPPVRLPVRRPARPLVFQAAPSVRSRSPIAYPSSLPARKSVPVIRCKDRMPSKPLNMINLSPTHPARLICVFRPSLHKRLEEKKREHRFSSMTGLVSSRAPRLISNISRRTVRQHAPEFGLGNRTGRARRLRRRRYNSPSCNTCYLLSQTAPAPIAYISFLLVINSSSSSPSSVELM